MRQFATRLTYHIFKFQEEKKEKTHDRAAHTDCDGKFHLVLHRHPNRGDMLSCVSLHCIVLRSKPNSTRKPKKIEHTTIGKRINPMNGFGT